MTAINFLRLLRKHIVLLLITPVLLAALVTFMTRKPAYTYSSETTLYTGIASGSSVEMDKSFSYFANNTAFDNLINVISSRNTQKEVAIRLLVQHLMLKEPDPRYVSAKSLEDLRRITPAYMNSLISKSNSKSSASDAKNQPGKAKNDQEPANSKSNNQNNGENDSVAPFSFSEFTSSAGVNTLPATINHADYEQTVKNLMAYMVSNDTNFVYELLYFDHPNYSIKAIAAINVQRIGSSDLVKLKFDSDDPGICQQTLAIMTEVCIENYKLIKENRSDAVVKYFEYQLRQAAGRLKIGEDKLLKFNEDNNIINYYEQSKAVAVVKEDLDVDYNNKRIKLAGYKASIKRIEEKLGIQQQVQLKSSTIIEKRNQLSEINSRLASAEIMGDGKDVSDAQLTDMKKAAETLKEEIRLAVNDLYGFGNNVEGIPISTLLSDWIANVIDYEDTKAGLEVLGERIKEFQKQYAIYAPAGANIKRIEREISVSEQEFLEILHGLNLAKLKMQDAELSSTIKPVDYPFFPLSPNPTKRKILIIAAALVGFLIVLSAMLATEYFDNTLRNAEKATKKLKLRTIGIFPKVFLDTGTLNFTFIANRVIEMIIQQIDLLAGQHATVANPQTLLILSSINQEGKTVIAGNIALKLKKQGKKVLFLNFSRESLKLNETNQIGYPAEPRKGAGKKSTYSPWRFRILTRLLGYGDNRTDPSSPFLQHPETYLSSTEYMHFPIEADYFLTGNYKDLIKKSTQIPDPKPDFVIIEIPPLLYNSFPPELISSAGLAILVCRANRVWSEADEGAVDIVKKITSKEPVIILNGVESDAIESVLGDLPKKRTRIRRIAKNLVRLQFYSRHQP
jgi:uncharacterized protein involved in exopolysaccharide biosynthesis